MRCVIYKVICFPNEKIISNKADYKPEAIVALVFGI